MTQEEKDKILEAEIVHIIESGANSIRLIECFKRHFERHYQQQPIPQDINKWIEDEAEKEEIYEPKYGGKDHSGYDTMMKYEINYERSECFEKGAKAMYQLLLPQLQECKEQLAQTKKELDVMIGNDLRQEKEIESLKQENERLKDYEENNKTKWAELIYWKQRCEAAENIIDNNDLWANTIEWETWQTLKQQTHG